MWKKFKQQLENVKKYREENPKQFTKIIMALLLAFLMSALVSQYLQSLAPKPEKITYVEYLELLNDGKIDRVSYSVSNPNMTIYLYNDETKDMSYEEREKYVYGIEDTKITTYPAYEDFRKELLEKNVNVVLLNNNVTFIDVLSMLITVAIPVIYIVLIIKMLRGTMGGGNDKENIIQTSDIKFSDVIGHDEILEDVKFITDLIKNPTKGEEIGAKVPKGILLCGEPGTGKTLIAKAIAGEADVPFLYHNASSFIEMFVGLGAKRVRNLFKLARESAPCIVFIDEIDSIGCSRNSRNSHSENEQTINALLQEMDGFTGREGIFIIAATNRADDLDSALTRTGRFDRIITVNPPRDWKVRKEIFKFYLNKLKVSDDVDLDVISKQTTGFTGSDVATICNEAGIVAMMNNKDCVDNECLEEAIDKHIFKGNRTKGSEEFNHDKKIVAYHEAGHAVMNFIVGLPMSRASIIANTSGVGGAVFGADQDSQFKTKKQYEDQVKVCYAGRISESIKFDDITTGASNDITQATQIIRGYVARFGFDESFGLIDMNVFRESAFINEEEVLQRIQKLAKELYADAEKLLKEKYDLVEKLAVELLERETLTGNEIMEVLTGKPVKDEIVFDTEVTNEEVENDEVTKDES